MKWDEEKDEFIIECSGRRAYANFGELSLGPDEYGEPRYGHDGGFVPNAGRPAFKFSTRERVEIANFMIDLWTKWRDR